MKIMNDDNSKCQIGTIYPNKEQKIEVFMSFKECTKILNKKLLDENKQLKKEIKRLKENMLLIKGINNGHN